MKTLQLLDQRLFARGLVAEACSQLLGRSAAVQEGIKTPLDALLHRREFTRRLSATRLGGALIAAKLLQRQIDRSLDHPLIERVPNGAQDERINEVLTQDDVIRADFGAPLPVQGAAVEGHAPTSRCRPRAMELGCPPDGAAACALRESREEVGRFAIEGRGPAHETTRRDAGEPLAVLRHPGPHLIPQVVRDNP